VGDQRHAPATLPPFFLSIRTNQTFVLDVILTGLPLLFIHIYQEHKTVPNPLSWDRRERSLANHRLRNTYVNCLCVFTATTLWPLYGVPCPVETYCLNGGTCFYYETVGELVCQ